MKSIFSFTLILSALLLCLLFAGCDDGSSNDNSSDDEASNDDANDDVNDDTNDDDTSDDEQNPSPYEFAPTPSDEIGVFVAKTGDDNNPGTMEFPKLTISAGVNLAEAQTKSVFVARGDYNESVEAEDVSLFGGYEEENWQRNIKEYITTIIATQENGLDFYSNLVGMFIIEGFSIFGGAYAENCQIENSAGIDIHDDAIISSCTINGGSPSDKASGINCDYCAHMHIYNSTIIGNTMSDADGNRPNLSPQSTIGINGDASFICIVNSVVHGGSSESGSYSRGITQESTGVLLSVNTYIYGGDPMEGDSNSIGIVAHGGYKDRFDGLGLINSNIDGGSGRDSSTAISMRGVLELAFYSNNIWSASNDCLLRYNSFNDSGFPYTSACLNSIVEINDISNIIWHGYAAKDNISRDCLLVDPSNADWHLDSSSPCIDSGIDAWIDWQNLYGDIVVGAELLTEAFHFEDVVKYDFDGEERPYGTAWDIGPDEWRP